MVLGEGRAVTISPGGSAARGRSKCVMLKKSMRQASGGSDSLPLSEAFSSSLLCFSH